MADVLRRVTASDAEAFVDSIVRLKLDDEHPDLFAVLQLFINDEWVDLTTGDRDDLEEMECDIAMAIEQALERHAGRRI